MTHSKRQSYLLFVSEDGDRLKQWTIRVDYLLICLAVAVLCSLFIMAVPLLQWAVPQSEHWAAPKRAHEIKIRGSAFSHLCRSNCSCRFAWESLTRGS
jgi:hypothetical protein